MAAVKIDRSALKATSVAKSQEADEVLNNMLSDPSRTEYIKIADGSNIIRFFPPHPGSGYTFTVPKVICRLPIQVDELDDKKNKTGKKIFISKSVFNSKVHGGAPNDLVEEYRRLAEEKSKRVSSNSEKQKEYLKPIFGVFSKDKTKNVQGIMNQESWIAYVSKIVGDKYINGRLEIKKAVKNRLNQISALETDGDPMGTDPFTDPDDGRAVKIVYNSAATQPQDYYQVELWAPSLKGQRGQVQLWPITDEQFDWFCQVTPLSEIYTNCFTRRDFELQLEGLENFDRIHKMGIFESEEFLEFVDLHDSLWPVIEDQQEEEEEEAPLPFKKSTAAERIQQKSEAAQKRVETQSVIKEGPKPKKEPEPEEEEESEPVTVKEVIKKSEENELPWSREEEEPVQQSKQPKPSALRDDFDEEQDSDSEANEIKEEAPKESLKDRLARLKAESLAKKG